MKEPSKEGFLFLTSETLLVLHEVLDFTFLGNGGYVFTLQRLMGHNSLEMVNRYLSLSQTDLEEAYRKNSPVDRMRL